MLKQIALVLVTLAAVATLRAQSSISTPYGSGYTSVDVDPNGTVTIYVETDVDGETAGSYYPELLTAFYDSTSNVSLAHAGAGQPYFIAGTYYSPASDPPGCTDESNEIGDQYGDVWAAVTCSEAGNTTDTYAGNSEHYLAPVESEEVALNPEYPNDLTWEYSDPYGYSILETDDDGGEEVYPNGMFWDAPVQTSTIQSPTINLGDTTNSSSGAVQQCGGSPSDVRNIMIAEYTSNHASYHPVCSDFTWIYNWTYSHPTFAQMTISQSTGGGQYAVLQTYIVTPLNNVTNDLGGYQPNINSGYRNPAAEKAQKHYYADSRHMAGDAVDLATQTNSQKSYIALRNAGIKEGACSEPDTVQGTSKNGVIVPNDSYNHLDWRNIYPATGTFVHTKCSAAWTTAY